MKKLDFLLVDDEEFVTRGLKRLLETLSLDVGEIFTALSPVEAMEILKTKEIDVVFTDIKMPEIDGIEFMKILAEQYPNCKVVVLSGYGNFEFAQQAIQNNVKAYLLKPITKAKLLQVVEELVENIQSTIKKESYYTKLQKQLDETKPKLKDNFFYKLASGNYDKAQKEFLNLDFGTSHKQIILISSAQYLENVAYDINAENEKQLFLLAVSNFIEHKVKMPDIDHCFIWQNSICVLLDTKLIKDNNYLEKILNKYILKIKNYVSDDLSVGISSRFVDFEFFDVYVRQAASALSYNKNNSYNIMFYDNISSASTQSLYMGLSRVKGLLYQELSAKRFEKVAKYIEYVQQDVKSGFELSEEMQKSFALEIFSVLSVFAYEQGLDSFALRIDGAPPAVAITKATDIDGVFAPLYKINSQIANYSNTKMAEDNANIISSIKTYILENIDKEITLETLSEVVYLTPNYISAIFKKETGISYKDYVLKEKINKAKQLLSSNQYKIYQVAQMVGYKSTIYFSKVFKNFTGSYPSDYHGE